MRKLSLFLVFLLFSSCTSNYSGQDYYGDAGHDQASPAFLIDNQLEHSKKVVPSIAASSYLSDNSFGPSNEFAFRREISEDPTKGKERVPIVGIFLGPGLQRTMVFLDLFKELRRQRISVHVLSGTGFGNVMAGLMASDLSFGRVEWVLFKFWNKSKNYEAYSKKWYGVFEDVILKEFGSLDIQSFGQLVFLPSALQDGKKHFFKIGKPRDVFRKVFFQFERKVGESGFIHFDKDIFLKRGVDITIYASVLGNQVILSKPNDFLKNSFEKFAMEKRSSLMFNHHDLYFDFLDGEDLAIDSFTSRKKWEKSGQVWARRSALKIRQAIKAWKEKSSITKD